MLSFNGSVHYESGTAKLELCEGCDIEEIDVMIQILNAVKKRKAAKI